MNNNNRIHIGRSQLLCAMAATGMMATLALPAHAQAGAETAALSNVAPRKGSTKLAMQTPALRRRTRRASRPSRTLRRVQ